MATPILTTRSNEEIAYLRAIKQVFDPNNIINPGKIFDLIHEAKRRAMQIATLQLRNKMITNWAIERLKPGSNPYISLVSVPAIRYALRLSPKKYR